MNTTPCVLNPAGWDLDLSRDVSLADRFALAAAAVDACRACPLQDACRAEAEAQPPRHACVWGALVYDGRGGPGMDLADWMETAAKADLRTRVGDVVTCPACGAEVTVDVPGRKFCDQQCASSDERKRRRVHGASDGGSRPQRSWAPAEVRREQVRQLVDAGLSRKEIAERLNMAPRSVRNYLSRADGTVGVPLTRALHELAAAQ